MLPLLNSVSQKRLSGSNIGIRLLICDTYWDLELVKLLATGCMYSYLRGVTCASTK